MGSVKPAAVGVLMVKEWSDSLERRFSLNQSGELLLQSEERLLDCVGDEDVTICCISSLKP